ncbi:V-type ATPase V1 subunit D [Schizosaccharomyces cryophilus OY26]|uniref:V-type ATPase V1 subunit D n=1 Tax=Schizosaccharomyces cryophilus (strain OY26 / ATCC MYA-4695 / CBS 11777 / NBRC 106824 / NRRL Y48691) TaxID=653667 RepID=S9VTH6_SCHCR|nr:V-type ATPase V1 subunit D [Schizosaccharomyces cryophilus OY26]EPY51178.1 V-type ATPase V1 subunit D [Schizosaccharomyces cryophilus OY26]
MSSGQRENVFPTRMTLTAIKTRLKGAQTGHSLLKRKSEALKKRFREIVMNIDQAKQKMGRVMQIAAFSMAEVGFATGSNINFEVQQSVKQARLKVHSKQENISGVFLPAFETKLNENIDDFQLTGLGRGGQQIHKARQVYGKAVETLVQLASYQSAFILLGDVLQVTNRRVNSIEHIIIPRLENTIKYIESELEELEREDFTRLKKVQKTKEQGEENEAVKDTTETGANVIQATSEGETVKPPSTEVGQQFVSEVEKNSDKEDSYSLPSTSTNVSGDEKADSDEDVIF